MEPKLQFIIEALQKRSNAILGFMVLQSLFLSHQLSFEGVVEKIKSIYGLCTVIIFIHVILVTLSITIIFFF
jgi:hypothetical protein